MIVDRPTDEQWETAFEVIDWYKLHLVDNEPQAVSEINALQYVEDCLPQSNDELDENS